MELNYDLIGALKVSHKNGNSVITLLKLVELHHPNAQNIKFLAMMALREAFNLSLRDVSPVGGWSGYGGELSDEAIIGLIAPCMDENITPITIN